MIRILVVHEHQLIGDTITAALQTESDFQMIGFAATPEALLQAIRRAVSAWHDKLIWHKLQRNGMALDFGWSKAAAAYRSVYAGLSVSRKKSKRIDIEGKPARAG